MVAALITAPDDADVGPLLAADLDPKHPGFATVRFHRARLLAAYGEAGKAYALLDDTQRVLAKTTGPSARAQFTRASFDAATTIDRTLKHVASKPAAERYDNAVGEPTDAPSSIHPRAARSLSAVPTGALVELVERDALPRPLQARLAATTWVRAHWVDRPDLAQRISDRVVALNPDVAELVARPTGRRAGMRGGSPCASDAARARGSTGSSTRLTAVL